MEVAGLCNGKFWIKKIESGSSVRIASGMTLWMMMSVCHLFGPDGNISTAIGWTAVMFRAHARLLVRVYYNNSSSHLAPSPG